MNIQDKVIIVTGASAGIGEATARLLAARRAKVVLAARREDRLRTLAAELPGSLAVVADVTKPEDIERLVETTVSHYGRVDGLVNNAGQGLHVPLEKVKLDDFRAVMELNVYGPLLLMQAVLPHMRKVGGGAIVNISSGTTHRPMPGVGAYAATKCALNMLSQVARAELEKDNIVVSLVYPIVTDTEFHHVLRDSSWGPGKPDWMPKGQPADLVAGYIVRCLVTGETEVKLYPDIPAAEV
jgi:NAD(P)-dependent dehydrogenase (short-subunit alcohol dehydrogenase family)